MTETPRIFVSYRRRLLADVQVVVDGLRAAGAEVFFDVEDIAPLAPFPERIREAIAASHAQLIWWSRDYADSDICLQELRSGWQHARRLTQDVGSRIWPLNPEADGQHLFAGELGVTNYLRPPSAADLPTWCAALVRRAAALTESGPLARGAEGLVNVCTAGVPRLTQRFVGRQAELWRIHSALHPVVVAGARRAAAAQVHGPPGLGKTELAAAYADSFAAAYPGGVIWLDMAGVSENDLDQPAAEAAWLKALQAALKDDHPWRTATPALSFVEGATPRTLADVKAQLQGLLGEQASLWIIDNEPVIASDSVRESVLSAWSGPGVFARTLITTRNGRALEGFSSLAVQTLPEETALQLLARFQTPTKEAAAQANELVQEVGAHTLALVLLGHRLAAPGASYAQILAELQDQGRLQRIEAIGARLRSSLGTRARSILATFATSIDRLELGARRLLCLAAQCAPNLPIPIGLLLATYAHVPGAPEDPYDCRDDVQLGLGELVDGGLLNRRRDDGQAIEIHPLIADATPGLAGLSDVPWRRLLTQPMLAALSGVADRSGDAGLALLLPHALQVASQESEHEQDRPDQLVLLNRVLVYHKTRAAPALAAQIAREALSRATAIDGPNGPQTLTARANLATSLTDLGDFAAAEQIQLSVWNKRRELLGDSHPSTIRAAHNLGEIYNQLNRLEEALEIQKWVLEERLRADPKGNEDTARSMNGLAGTLVKLNRLHEAEELHRRAWATRRAVLGDHNVATLTSAYNVAMTLLQLGNVPNATGLLREVLDAIPPAQKREPLATLTAFELYKLLRGTDNDGEAQFIFTQALAWLRDAEADALEFHQRQVRRELFPA